MKQVSFALVCCSMLIVSPSNDVLAQAPSDEGFYASAYLGLHAPTDNNSNVAGIDELTWDAGYRLGASVGVRLGQLRYEGELGYRGADGDVDFDSIFLSDLDVELSVLQGSFNVFYDLLDLSLGGITSTPYLGAGLGYANVEIEGNTVDDESGLLFLLEGGLTLRLGSNLAIVPAYRYEYVDVEILNDDALTAHSLQLAARFDF